MNRKGGRKIKNFKFAYNFFSLLFEAFITLQTKSFNIYTKFNLRKLISIDCYLLEWEHFGKGINSSDKIKERFERMHNFKIAEIYTASGQNPEKWQILY